MILEGIILPWLLTIWMEFSMDIFFFDKWSRNFSHQANSSDPKFRIQMFLASLKGANYVTLLAIF